MPEKDLNLEWNMDISDLSTLGIDETSLENLDIEEVLEDKWDTGNNGDIGSISSSEFDTTSQRSTIVDENVFLDSWDNSQLKKNVLNDKDNFWKYLRRFFVSSILILLGVLAIAALYLFRTYIKAYSNPNPDPKSQEYIDKCIMPPQWTGNRMPKTWRGLFVGWRKPRGCLPFGHVCHLRFAPSLSNRKDTL